MTSPSSTLENVTCLGCGCACDDIHVTTRDNRIVEARNACDLGVAWFGDGQVPTETRVAGREASLQDAINAAATLLASAARPLVYLAPDLSCEAQRELAAIADALGVGGLKMKIHKACIARLFEKNDLVLDAETIADVANDLSKS